MTAGVANSSWCGLGGVFDTIRLSNLVAEQNQFWRIGVGILAVSHSILIDLEVSIPWRWNREKYCLQ